MLLHLISHAFESSFPHHCMSLFLPLISYLCCFISCINSCNHHNHIHLNNPPLRVAFCQSSVKNIHNKVSAGCSKLQNFSLHLTMAFKCRQMLKHICWLLTNIWPARLFLLLRCYLVLRTALIKYYDQVLSCFSSLEALMKENVSKNSNWMRSHD